jgi:hypothetical protein
VVVVLGALVVVVGALVVVVDPIVVVVDPMVVVVGPIVVVVASTGAAIPAAPAGRIIISPPPTTAAAVVVTTSNLASFPRIPVSSVKKATPASGSTGRPRAIPVMRAGPTQGSAMGSRTHQRVNNSARREPFLARYDDAEYKRISPRLQTRHFVIQEIIVPAVRSILSSELQNTGARWRPVVPGQGLAAGASDAGAAVGAGAGPFTSRTTVMTVGAAVVGVNWGAAAL